ncbi:hypothetical protein [Rhizobiales bacterium]|uniref:hypothetical protein n=1 Tax=Ensifer sp. R-19 TaxID=3404055 RepID=UPI000DDF58C8
MSDLAERLRRYRPRDDWGVGEHHTICDEAAEHIEQLQRENRALSELRRDLVTLQKRIIGETGLSAIETIDRALKVFDAKHLYEIFDEEHAARQEQGAEE